MANLKTESFFEKLCQRITLFIASHMGSVTALLILVAASVIFSRNPQSPFSAWLEDMLTLLSLVLLFFLQRSQTKDTLSLQIKLNELLKAVERADETLINVEEKSEEELKALHDRHS